MIRAVLVLLLVCCCYSTAPTHAFSAPMPQGPLNFDPDASTNFGGHRQHSSSTRREIGRYNTEKGLFPAEQVPSQNKGEVVSLSSSVSPHLQQQGHQEQQQQPQQEVTDDNRYNTFGEQELLQGAVQWGSTIRCFGDYYTENVDHESGKSFVSMVSVTTPNDRIPHNNNNRNRGSRSRSKNNNPSDIDDGITPHYNERYAQTQSHICNWDSNAKQYQTNWQ